MDMELLGREACKEMWADFVFIVLFPSLLAHCGVHDGLLSFKSGAVQENKEHDDQLFEHENPLLTPAPASTWGCYFFVYLQLSTLVLISAPPPTLPFFKILCVDS